MSAGKLEKKLAALERRMREEMRLELSVFWQRLQTVEEKLRLEQPSSVKMDKLEDAQEANLPGSVLSAVVPSVVTDVTEAGHKHEVELDRTEMFQSAIHEVQDEDQDEEPIPFGETVWNVILVLGFSGAGWADVCLTMVLAFLSVLMQFMFVYVLLGPYFLGGDFELEIAAARTWRASIAHDAKYRDLAGTSLAARVCNGDGSLIQSNEQAKLITEINDFLGLAADQFASTGGAQPGLMLCGLCILLWCMYLSKEFRAIWISIEAALQIPRARRTVFRDGRFIAISYFRLGIYLLIRLARTGMACCLLYAGQQWLSRTTNVTDLILNAVALGAILEIDEVIFASVLPKKMQAAIYDLEAIKVRYTRRKSQLEGCCFFIAVAVMTLVPLIVWVVPLADTMLKVKAEFCDGTLDFVVAYNQDQQLTIGLNTAEFKKRSEVGFTISETAVLEHVWPTNLSEVQLVSFSDSTDAFAADSVASMEVLSDEFPSCLDADHWQRRYGTVFADIHMPRFRSAAALQGRDNATSCADLADRCNDWDARLLRHVCGQTCQCDVPTAYPWFKVKGQGCSATCRERAATLSKDIPCTDSLITAEWLAFWDSYPDVMAKQLGLNLTSPQAPASAAFIHKLVEFMKTTGCRGLVSVQEDPVTRTSWCAGSAFSSPLAYLCPVACGCTAASPPEYCLLSCKACGDVLSFPSVSGISSCADAESFGICGIPAEAETFCSETCGICNGTFNASGACPDGPLPSFFGLGTCADVKANGYCPLLRYLGSSVSLICGKSCEACT